MTFLLLSNNLKTRILFGPHLSKIIFSWKMEPIMFQTFQFVCYDYFNALKVMWWWDLVILWTMVLDPCRFRNEWLTNAWTLSSHSWWGAGWCVWGVHHQTWGLRVPQGQVWVRGHPAVQQPAVLSYASRTSGPCCFPHHDLWAGQGAEAPSGKHIPLQIWHVKCEGSSPVCLLAFSTAWTRTNLCPTPTSTSLGPVVLSPGSQQEPPSLPWQPTTSCLTSSKQTPPHHLKVACALCHNTTWYPSKCNRNPCHDTM